MFLQRILPINDGKHLHLYNAEYKMKNGQLLSYEIASRDEYHTLKDNLWHPEHIKPTGISLIVLDNTKEHLLLLSEFRPALNCNVLRLCEGMFESNETPIDCAKRELMEETGLTLQAICTVLPDSFATDGISNTKLKTLVCTANGIIQPSTNPREPICAKWVTKDEANTLLIPSQTTLLNTRAMLALYHFVNGSF